MGEGTRVRLAVPSDLPGGLDASRSGHFGRCACFTLVDLTDGEPGDVEVVVNARHTQGGCMSPVLQLAEHNVGAVIVDGIGGRPLQGLAQVGIAVLAGDGQTVRAAVDVYARGGLPAVAPGGSCGGH